MLRGDAPRLQVLWPEVAQIKGHNDRRPAVDCGRYNVAILVIVRHPGNELVVTTDPGLTEVNSQIGFKMSGQRTRPLKLRFQRASCLPNDLLRPFRLEEPRRLRETQERIAQREIGKDAGVEDDERRTRHSWPGINTRS